MTRGQTLAMSVCGRQGIDYITEQLLGVNAVTVVPSASFIDDLGGDSRDTVEPIMALEKEFGCEIPEDEATKIATVQDAIDFVTKMQ